MAHHQAQVLQAQEQVYSGLVLTLPFEPPATQAGFCTTDLHYAMNGPFNLTSSSLAGSSVLSTLLTICLWAVRQVYAHTWWAMESRQIK